MLYELRIYQPGGGRMADMEVLMARDCTEVLRRAKMPRPLGAWRAVAGPRLPAFLWILAWDSMAERNAAWAAFGADIQWQQLRLAAHTQTELTVRVDTEFMAAWPEIAPEQGADLSPTGGVYQLLVHRVKTGMGAAFKKAFLDADRAVIEECDGRVVVGFDFLSGEDLPVSAVLVRWPDMARHAIGAAAYDSHPKLKAERIAERARYGCDVFLSVDRYLMESSLSFGK